MKITFLSNIPSPYRIDFFNELGKYISLKVIFEAERNYDLNKKWYKDIFDNFECIFLKKGAIEEKKINWKILKYLNKRNQDLIVVTNYSYFTELLALLYIKLKRIPYCMEVDGGIIKRESIFLKFFKRFLIKGAKAYISPSKSTDNFLMYYGANKDKIYRYNFTSLKNKDILSNKVLKKDKDTIKNKLGIKEEKIIVSVGRFIYLKGFDILLESCVNLKYDTGVYIIGGEAKKEYLDIIEKLNLKNINFVDFKSKEELYDYYKVADVFVLPTRSDVWGLVINEAMSVGLPIITTTNCVAGLELIQNDINGYIIPSENSEILAEKINLLLKDDKLREIMKKNNLIKISEYSIEKMAKDHFDIFKKILNKL
ncbi:glycosyltransferase family 4 protein [Clostridium perfringens]